jgi:hypothetical protein
MLQLVEKGPAAATSVLVEELGSSEPRNNVSNETAA